MLLGSLGAFGALAFELYALAFEPFALDPSKSLRHRLLQRRHILREQKESERQHPEAKDRQEREEAAEDQESRERNPHQPRRRPPQPVDETRRASRRFGLFAPHLVKEALRQSFVMLRPDIQWKNPVMFVVEVGTVLTLLFTVAVLFGYQSRASVGYLIALDVWLLLTLLFANFATSLAEARGKAALPDGGVHPGRGAGLR